LFVFCVLVTVVSLLTALILAIRRRPAAKRVLKALGIGWAVYLSVVVLVAAMSPPRIIPMNQDLCSDEMCFAVTGVQTAAQLGSVRPTGIFYIVTVRVSNRGRGRAQRENGLQARLWSPAREYEISPAGQSAWDAEHPENV